MNIRHQLIEAIKNKDIDEAVRIASLLTLEKESQLPLLGRETGQSFDSSARNEFIRIVGNAIHASDREVKVIREVSNRRPDPGTIVRTLIQEDITGLEQLPPTVYLHVKPALATRFDSLDKVWRAVPSETWLLEPKLDGEEIQVHIGKDGVMLFSGNGKVVTLEFSDVTNSIQSSFGGITAIIEGEIVAFDFETNNYLSRASLRNPGISKRIVAYDLLLLDAQDWTRRSSLERSRRLMQLLKDHHDNSLVFTEQVIVHDLASFASYLHRCIEDYNLEGLIAKDPSAAYHAGSRLNSRIKLKPVDTIDAIAEGCNLRTGAVLLSVWDSDAHRKVPFAWAFADQRTSKELKAIQARRKISPRKIGGKILDEVFDATIIVEAAGSRIKPTKNFEIGWTLFAAKIVSLRWDLDIERVTTVEDFLRIQTTMGEDPPSLFKKEGSNENHSESMG